MLSPTFVVPSVFSSTHVPNFSWHGSGRYSRRPHSMQSELCVPWAEYNVLRAVIRDQGGEGVIVCYDVM